MSPRPLDPLTELTAKEVRSEVREAWRLAGLKTTTAEHLDRMVSALALVLLRSPAETAPLVEAAIINAERRATYLKASSRRTS